MTTMAKNSPDEGDGAGVNASSTRFTYYILKYRGRKGDTTASGDEKHRLRFGKVGEHGSCRA